MANPHIYISEKQIKKRHLNKETGKYEGFDHTFLKDKEGKPLQMVRVLLPSAGHRELQFEPDIHGIDRNSREAYIQVPLDAIKDTKIKRRKVLYLTCKTSTFTIYFKGERIRNPEDPNVGKFDKPVNIKVGIKELQKIWPSHLPEKTVTKENSKEKETTQKKEKEINAPDKEKSKQITKPVRQKENREK